MKKLLIFGSSGMAGHVVYDILSKRMDIDVQNVSYRTKINEKTILLDISNLKLVEDIIKKVRPDIIINCVGVLIRGSKNDPANAILINSYFPHFLSKIAHENNGVLYHLSTDCVFSGYKGDYTTHDTLDSRDHYGLTKALGEVNNQYDLTIRTSIIGPEIKLMGEGLFHWFLSQTGVVSGYTESLWNGVTTLQLAKFIEQAVDNNLHGLIQYSSTNKISKHDLLLLIKEIWERDDIKLNAISGKHIDKSLVPNYPEFIHQVPTYHRMLEELKGYMSLQPVRYSYYLKKGNR